MRDTTPTGCRMKRRRAFLSAAFLAIMPFPAANLMAQPGSKTPVIGLLDAGERPDMWTAFRQRMAELGYKEGRNVTFVQRYAKGNIDAAATFAKELVQQKVAVIATAGAAAALAAQRATSTIPIVMASGADQVGLGLASSFAKPGANVTGVSSFTPDLMTKRLELLREVVPNSSRIGAIWHRDNISSMASVREIDGAAAKVSVGFQSFGISDARELEDVFATMSSQRIDLLIVVNAPLMFLLREQVASLALKHRLPAIYGSTEYVESGGLIAYGPSYTGLARRAAVYVDKILKGARPGELPIELPMTFELAINLKTAKVLGLTVPQSLLLRADEVIR